jgi:hypothetical protein
MKGKGSHVGRNDLCHCGSGKKFKHCHGAKATSLTTRQRLALGLIVTLAIAGLLLALNMREEPSGQTGVWSAEHGHYH